MTSPSAIFSVAFVRESITDQKSFSFHSIELKQEVIAAASVSLSDIIC
jgi:hypothetical protein